MSVLELEKPQQEEQAPEELSVKDAVHSLLDRLPDDVTWERLEYHIHVCRVVAESERDAEKNGYISDAVARERLKRWLD